jgi:hypothetical protein
MHCDEQHDSYQRESEYFAQQFAVGRTCALVLGDKVSTLLYYTLSVGWYVRTVCIHTADSYCYWQQPNLVKSGSACDLHAASVWHK